MPIIFLVVSSFNISLPLNTPLTIPAISCIINIKPNIQHCWSKSPRNKMKDKIYLQRLREHKLKKNNFLILSGEGVCRRQGWDETCIQKYGKSRFGGAVTSRKWYRISHYPARYQKQFRSDIINILLWNLETLSVKGRVHEIRKTSHLVITNTRNYNISELPKAICAVNLPVHCICGTQAILSF